MSGAVRRRFWALLVVSALVLSVAPARARFVPLQTTPAGVAERVAEASDWARGIGPTLGVTAKQLDALSRCDGVASQIERGDADAIGACGKALGDVYGALAEVDESDARRHGAAWFTAWGVADAAFRVGSAHAAALAGEPGKLVPGAGVPAQILVHGDFRTLQIRPLRALRPGRRWSLIVSGLTPEEKTYARETVVPKMGPDGLEIPAGAFVDLTVAGMRDDPGPMNHEAAIAVARSIEDDVRGQDGTSPVAGVQVRLPSRIGARDLARLVPSFVPSRDAPPGQSIVDLPVFDLRKSFTAFRERLAGLGCPDEAVRERPDLVEGLEQPGATVVEGRYPSLDIRGEAGERPVEVGAEAAPVVELPFLLALPADAGPDTPLVIAIHGHGGDGESFLSEHAGGLLSRGLAMLVVDLPDHGARGSDEMEFLGVLDPARLRVNYRQSLLDILAVLRVAGACGFPTTDGSRYRPGELRYFGYSFGSLLGVSVRSLSPELGPTVFVAAAGDLAHWLMLYFPNYLDSAVMTCVGGAQQGRECRLDQQCAAPGVCWIDPYFVRIAFLFDLPFALALAGAEPLGPARVRTGDVSQAPALLLTSGEDGVLFTLLQARLGDAYDMHGEPPGSARGPRTERRHWPDLGHDLKDDAEVRSTAYDFLAAPRRPRPPSPANPSVDNKQAGG